MEKRIQPPNKMVKRFVVTGPESTGKSALTKQLAEHFNEPYVSEFARTYLANLNRPYTAQDIEFIATEQIKNERAIQGNANQYLFCDTATLVPKIWFEYKYHKQSHIIENLWLNTQYTGFLLCDIDLPWENDPLREHPEERSELYDLYYNTLSASKVSFQVIQGQGQVRLQNAIKAVFNLSNDQTLIP